MEPRRSPLARGESLLTFYPHPFEQVDAESAARIWHAVPGLRDGALLVGPNLYVYPRMEPQRLAAPLEHPLNPADTWVVAPPRCGATWVQEMVWLIANGCDFEGARSELWPVRWEDLERTYDCLQSPAIVRELWWSTVKASIFNLPRMLWVAAKVAWYRTHQPPRFIKTHMPFAMLPPKLLDECKVVYVARNPKDALVSYYHHHKLFLTYGCDGTFEDFFNLFVENKLMQMPFFPHVLEAWEKRLHPRLLFIFYEEMKSNLRVVIRRVADFLRKELSDEDVESLYEHLKFETMSKNPFVQLQWLRDLGLMSETEAFFRKGETGDWKNYFTPAMNVRMDAWIRENLRGSDLHFVTELERQD